MFVLFVVAGFAAMLLAHTAPFPFLLESLPSTRSQWQMPARERPTIYLTFDDGPNPTATPGVLDALAAQQAHATFFVIDKHLTEETAPIVRRMFAEGHAVGLHSDTRGHMLMDPERLAAALTAAADRIADLTGSRPCRAYRPHAGFRSGSMYAALSRIDYTLVGWGWMLWDWNWYRRPDPDVIVSRVARRAAPGDIVVMHDGHHEDPRADRLYAVEAIERLVPAFRTKGFSFGTIC